MLQQLSSALLQLQLHQQRHQYSITTSITISPSISISNTVTISLASDTTANSQRYYGTALHQHGVFPLQPVATTSGSNTATAAAHLPRRSLPAPPHSSKTQTPSLTETLFTYEIRRDITH